MSFIAGYLTGLTAGQSSTIYDQVLALPQAAVFRVTDNYLFVMRYDSRGLFIDSPAVEATGIMRSGEPIAYISKEYLQRPLLWLCLCRNTLSDVVMINYSGYFTYEGWGHTREYRYDVSTGVYLSSECVQLTAPTVTFAYQPDQRYNIGTLSMQWIYEWQYSKTSYTAGGEETEDVLTGRIASIQTVPNVLLNGLTILPPAQVQAILREFAAECEEKREELIG